MVEQSSKDNLEIEIKVRLGDRAAFAAGLPALGFHLQTPETMERNTLYDTPEGQLRQRRELLRIRPLRQPWVLTHKAPAENVGWRHRARVETEIEISDGEALAAIFERLGYRRSFVYFRSEWADGEGHIVLDVTPIGDFAELEGKPAWIDATAAKLEFQLHNM